MIKNLLCNTGDMGSIPGQGTKIPHALQQLSLRSGDRKPQLERVLGSQRTIPQETMKTLNATTKTEWSQINTLIFFKKDCCKKKKKVFRLLQEVGGDVIVMTSDWLNFNIPNP